MDLATKIKGILEEFERNPAPLKQGINGKNSIYTQISAYDFISLIGTLRNEKKIRARGLFLDAGSGSGLPVALLSALGYVAVGIDWDARLVDYAKNKLKDLRSKGYIGNTSIVNGDFNDPKTYSKLGVPFEKIPHVFHALNKKSGQKLIENMAHNQIIVMYGPFGQLPKAAHITMQDPVQLSPMADYTIYSKHMHRTDPSLLPHIIK